MGGSQIMHVKPKREFEYISGVECLEHYRLGGYHPVKLGDSLCKGRYTILHKLGYGATSTIWLAADRDAEQLVALKIKTAESAHNSTEINLLSKLAGETFVQRLLDVFSLAGPNGTHQCLVLEAAQCSIHTAKELSGHQLLNLSIARSIIAGLILGVQRLHSIGIVHGDLHIGNFLLRMPEDIRRITNPVSLYARIGEPVQMPPVRLDGGPISPGTPPLVIWDAAMDLPSDAITTKHLPVMIADFGESLEPAITKRLHAHTLPALCPPESFFTKVDSELDSISFASDIWTLACSIWEIMGDSPPFLPWGKARDEILLQHVKIVGKLPEAWWASWETKDQCLDETEQGLFLVKEKRLLKDWGTRESLERRYDWCISEPRKTMGLKGDDLQDDSEKHAFLDLMQMMLVHEPSKRSTIDDVVNSDWVQKWVLPD
ncbi:hypothetical protein MaudMau93_005428 [Microsporum audouinii]